MADTTEGKPKDDCASMQEDFLRAFRKHLEDSARIDNLDNRVTELKKEHDEFRKTFTGFMEKLEPVHAAYLKGMTLKAKIGNIAIAYVVISIIFPQFSPSAIISAIKLLL